MKKHYTWRILSNSMRIRNAPKEKLYNLRLGYCHRLWKNLFTPNTTSPKIYFISEDIFYRASRPTLGKGKRGSCPRHQISESANRTKPLAIYHKWLRLFLVIYFEKPKPVVVGQRSKLLCLWEENALFRACPGLFR